jgi:hypothetical protein
MNSLRFWKNNKTTDLKNKIMKILGKKYKKSHSTENYRAIANDLRHN